VTDESGAAPGELLRYESELSDLRARLRDAEEALDGIRSGEVDAVVVKGPLGQQIYTIANADRTYRLLIEQMKEGAVTILNTGLIVYCNNAFAALLGKSAAQVSGSRFQQHLLQSDVALFETLLGSEDGGRAVVSLLSPAAAEIPVNVSLSPLPGNTERVICTVVTDLRQLRQTSYDLAEAGARLADQIAVRERAEALLHQAQKMEVVGQLTGGLAHDFNNLLMIIGGNLDLIRRRISDDRIAQKIDQVLLAVQRGAKLTQQLLAFSRTQTLSPESICINNLLPEIEMLIFRALGPEIEVGFDLAEDLWFCRVDPNQLESSILNLAINARDAMANGGKLTVGTENRLLDQDEAAALGDIAPGRYVAVTLTDTGEGIPSHVLSRVFEPFYTTKEVGKGSGLGLSQVYGFARQSGGHVSIRSDVGRGTSVCLYFPWTEPADAIGPQVARAIEPVSAGQPKILIVEDDHELRELATQLVQGLGYSACTASNGAEAMAALERDSNIGLLFTDIIMPGGMSGIELAVETRRRWPDLGILMTSGFPGHLRPGAPLGGEFAIIRKPFTQAELAAAFSKVTWAAKDCLNRLPEDEVSAVCAAYSRTAGPPE
jgi:PAS domain S-box-containing protein